MTPLSQEQANTITKDFKALIPYIDSAGEFFYFQLQQTMPTLKLPKGFYDPRYGRRMMQVLGLIVQNLEHLDEVIPILTRKIVKYRLETIYHYYPIAITQALMKTLQKKQRFTKEQQQAWMALFRLLWIKLRDYYKTHDIYQEFKVEGNHNYQANEHTSYLSLFFTQPVSASDNSFTPKKTLATTAAKKTVAIYLENDQKLLADTQQTLLENFLQHKIPMIFVCGGVGECTSCRVEVIEGIENCLSRTPKEEKIATQMTFPSNVRLACQTVATDNLKIRRLVIASEDDYRKPVCVRSFSTGNAMNLAVMFADIRDFTPFSEKNTPYDVIHMLNQYYSAICLPIHDHGGFIDKYMGDGIMALFGLNAQHPEHPAVAAAAAALEMKEALASVNNYLQAFFNHHFDIGIGIHYGEVVVGEVGFPLKKEFTALGDVVNTAARIEHITRQQNCDILLSVDTAAYLKSLAAKRFRLGREITIALKGKAQAQILVELLDFA